MKQVSINENRHQGREHGLVGAMQTSSKGRRKMREVVKLASKREGRRKYQRGKGRGKGRVGGGESASHGGDWRSCPPHPLVSYTDSGFPD